VSDTTFVGNTNRHNRYFNIVLVRCKSNASYTLFKWMSVAIVENIALRKNDKGFSLFELLQDMANKIELRMSGKGTDTT